ncbi:MAG TPA: sulfatase [bacterium]|nr:sulfatase [bacterium]
MTPDGTDSSRRPPSAAAAIRLGLRIGLTLSFAAAVAETAAAVALTARHLGAEWPLRLAPAVFGQVFLTHAVLWCPLGGLLAWALRGRARADGTPAASVTALLLVVLAAVAVPADVALATQEGNRTLVLGGLAVAAALAAGSFFLIRRAAARGDGRGPDRFFGAASVVAAVALIASFVVLLRSPLFDAASYRVASTSPEASTGDDRPDVLWVVLDTARPDRMTVHSPELATTPFLAEWAERSIVCDQAVSNGIWTAPTHASMFTGRSVREHGVTFANPHLAPDIPTVAEALRDAGWTTATFSNNPVVSPATGVTRGFEEQHAVDHLRPVTHFSLQHLVETRGWVPPFPWLDPDFGAAITNWMIARWLDERDASDGPAFVFVNYMEAHAPYTVPGRYRRMFLDAEEIPRSYELREKAYGDLPKVLNTRFNMEGGAFLPDSDRELLRKQYDATVRYLDDRVRELIRIFEERGRLDRTVVIFSTDHGEYLGDHGLWGHEFLTYNELTRVLLMLREPGRTEPLRITTPVLASELHDAVLAAALGAPGGIAAGDPAERAGAVAVTEYNGPWPRRIAAIEELDDPRLQHLIHPQLAVQDRSYKLLVSTDGTSELYDLAAGPEVADLSGDLPAERERLAAHLRTWAETTPEFRPAGDDSAAGMDADTVKRLEALGYLGD